MATRILVHTVQNLLPGFDISINDKHTLYSEADAQTVYFISDDDGVQETNVRVVRKREDHSTITFSNRLSHGCTGVLKT